MKESYRENVAAIIINKEKKVLMCEHMWIDNAWQLPQGGVDDGENNEEAILRELNEELGNKSFKIVKEMDHSLKYKYPYNLKEKYNSSGQVQRYFLVYFYGDDSEIRFDNQEKPEFKAFEWVNYEVPPLRVIYFKKLVYYEAIKYFKEEVEKFDPIEFEKSIKV